MWKRDRMTIFMIPHDVKESFQVGTRLLVFDKLRHDLKRRKRTAQP